MEAERARELLARERARMEEELRSLSEDVPDEDDPTFDKGTELFEVERDQGLAEDLRVELLAIERAEQRLADGTYGLSIESGEPIPDARLEAIPWAERTVEEQARYDAGR
jgi:DnaK suppressor protein